MGEEEAEPAASSSTSIDVLIVADELTAEVSTTNNTTIDAPPHYYNNKNKSKLGRRGLAHSTATSIHVLERTLRPTYLERSTSYFENRKLTYRRARLRHIVAVVCLIQLSSIQNNDWSQALAFGYGSFLIAFVLTIGFYLCFAVIMAELMTMLPYSGGMSTSVRAALGPYFGYLVGQCELAEYTVFVSSFVTNARIITSLGADASLEPLWWTLQLASYLALSLYDTGVLLNIIVAIAGVTVLAVPIGLLPVLANINVDDNAVRPIWNYSFNSTDVAVTSSQPPPAFDKTDGLFPTGVFGIISALPYTFRVLQGMETIPIMAEECNFFIRDGPKAIFISLAISSSIMLLAFAIIPATPPGAMSLMDSLVPNVEAISRVFGMGYGTHGMRVIVVVAVVVPVLGGILASAHAFSRLAFALSRTGYMLNFIAWTKLPHKKEHTPWVAAIYLTLTSLTMTLVGRYLPSWTDALAFSATIYGVLAYLLTSLAFLILKFRVPNLNRPWRARPSTSITCALVVLVASFVILCIIMMWDVQEQALYVCAFKLILGMVFMFLFLSRRLVMSPEEVFIHSHVLKTEVADMISTDTLREALDGGDETTVVRNMTSDGVAVVGDGKTHPAEGGGHEGLAYKVPPMAPVEEEGISEW